MRGLIGERLLRRFAGRIEHPLELTPMPEAGSNPVEREAAGHSESRSSQTWGSNELVGYGAYLEKASHENTYFRRVLVTCPRSQLALMAIEPCEDIGLETHPDTDQLIRIESGRGRAIVGGQHYDLKDGSVFVIPAGAEHNLINTSPDAMLKLYTIYMPPAHLDGTVHKTRAEAHAATYHERA